IVKGLIAMLLRIFSGRTPQEIVDTSPAFIGAIGLDQHLSPSRSNGLNAMILRIKEEARSRL
ncbi:SufE family protein, partial [Escherichia coli]|uniref:SufE family protein n=1 Tax=Escherichia coli TaxID=562 RepID=UPI0015BBF15F